MYVLELGIIYFWNKVLYSKILTMRREKYGKVLQLMRFVVSISCIYVSIISRCFSVSYVRHIYYFCSLSEKFKR